MQPYLIKNIEVQIFGNDISIEIRGEFYKSNFCLDRVDVTRLNNGIELQLITNCNQNEPAIAVAEPFRRIIALNSLKPGVYYARVDNNNNWLKWFKMPIEILQPLDHNHLIFKR
jgi:hypothetical protein